MYRLKKRVADFTVVDGPFAKRSYREGEVYPEKDIPPREKHKFELIDGSQASLSAVPEQAEAQTETQTETQTKQSTGVPSAASAVATFASAVATVAETVSSQKFKKGGK